MAVGHDWKHGYIPLTPQAMREKNHGRAVKPGSWVTKLPGVGSANGPKVGETAAGKALHVGDVVHVHTGPHAGKEGVVIGAAGKGRILVGKPGTTGQGFFAQNAHVQHARDHQASTTMNSLLRAKAGDRTVTPPRSTTASHTKEFTDVASDVHDLSPAAAQLLHEAAKLRTQGRERAADNRITKAYNTLARAVSNETDRKRHQRGNALLNRVRGLR